MASPADVWLLGETKGFWINTGALVISILVAAAAIWSASSRERKRSTLEFLNRRHVDKELIDAIRFVRHGLKDRADFSFVLLPHDDSAEMVKTALNYHEFVAQSIMQKALDEAMYKQMQYTNLMNFWRSAKPVVAYIREKTGVRTLYQDLEWLYERWHHDPIVSNTNRCFSRY